jgi:hypothetical protein
LEGLESRCSMEKSIAWAHIQYFVLAVVEVEVGSAGEVRQSFLLVNKSSFFCSLTATCITTIKNAILSEGD